MSRRLKTIAAEIQREFQDLDVKVERRHYNTDRDIPGTQLRHPGKGRWGNLIIVTDRVGRGLMITGAIAMYASVPRPASNPGGTGRVK